MKSKLILIFKKQMQNKCVSECSLKRYVSEGKCLNCASLC
jgi:hypothetical protein